MVELESQEVNPEREKKDFDTLTLIDNIFRRKIKSMHEFKEEESYLESLEDPVNQSFDEDRRY